MRYDIIPLDAADASDALYAAASDDPGFTSAAKAAPSTGIGDFVWIAILVQKTKETVCFYKLQIFVFQVQPNILMNPQMAQAMPAQEMMQQFPNAAMAQLARPGVQMQPGMEGMQNLQAMQQQFSFMNLAGQQQAFAQGVRNPGFMGPRFPPPMPPSSTPDIPRTTPIPLEDPAIITTIPNDPSFGGPGSAFVDHSEQAKLPSIPKPELPLRVSPHLAEPAEEETPVPKPSTVDPMSTLTTEQPKKNTPGIIHLPPAFPTEEEMLLSPDSTSGKNLFHCFKKYNEFS